MKVALLLSILIDILVILGLALFEINLNVWQSAILGVVSYVVSFLIFNEDL